MLRTATAPAPEALPHLIDEWLDACTTRRGYRDAWTAATILYEDYRAWFADVVTSPAQQGDLAAPADFEAHLIAATGIPHALRRVQGRHDAAPHHARCFALALIEPLRAA